MANGSYLKGSDFLNALDMTDEDALRRGEVTLPQAQSVLSNFLSPGPGAKAVGTTSPRSARAVNRKAKAPASQGVSFGDILGVTNNIPQGALDMTTLPNGVQDRYKQSPMLGETSTARDDFSRTNQSGRTTLTSKDQDTARAESYQAQGWYPQIIGYATGPDGQPDETQPIYDFVNASVDPTHPLSQERTNIAGDLLYARDLAQIGASTPAKLGGGWLEQLANAERSRKGLSALSPGVKSENTLSMVQDELDKVRKRQQAYNQVYTSGLNAQKGGQIYTKLADALKRSDEMKAANPHMPAGGGSNAQRKADEIRYRQAMAIANRPDVQRAMAAANTAASELALTNSKLVGPVSKQQFEELQLVVRNLPAALITARGGMTTGAERESMTMKSLQKTANDILSHYSNTVSEIPANDPQLVHFRNLTKELQSRFQDIYKNRLEALGSGMKSVLERNPDLNSDFNAFLGGAYKGLASGDTSSLKKTALPGYVRVKSPDGRTGQIPQEKLKEYLDKGFTKETK